MASCGEESLAPVLNSMTVPLLPLSGILLPLSLAPLCYFVDGIRAEFLGQYSNT
jgi:ABC-2 type transport system permease protein